MLVEVDWFWRLVVEVGIWESKKLFVEFFMIMIKWFVRDILYFLYKGNGNLWYIFVCYSVIVYIFYSVFKFV